MSKSILVIDTPKNCYSCPMMYDSYGIDDYCAVKQTIIEDYKIRPHWCPLSLLPEKEPLLFGDYSRGWNDCIKKIKEEENVLCR